MQHTETVGSSSAPDAEKKTRQDNEALILKYARNGDLGGIKELLADDPTLITASTPEGANILIYAANCYHGNIVEYIVENYVNKGLLDIDAVYTSNETHFSQPFLKTMTATESAARFKIWSIATYLVQHGGSNLQKVIFFAAQENRMDVLYTLFSSFHRYNDKQKHDCYETHQVLRGSSRLNMSDDILSRIIQSKNRQSTQVLNWILHHKLFLDSFNQPTPSSYITYPELPPIYSAAITKQWDKVWLILTVPNLRYLEERELDIQNQGKVPVSVMSLAIQGGRWDIAYNIAQRGIRPSQGFPFDINGKNCVGIACLAPYFVNSHQHNVGVFSGNQSGSTFFDLMVKEASDNSHPHLGLLNYSFKESSKFKERYPHLAKNIKKNKILLKEIIDNAIKALNEAVICYGIDDETTFVSTNKDDIDLSELLNLKQSVWSEFETHNLDINDPNILKILDVAFSRVPHFSHWRHLKYNKICVLGAIVLSKLDPGSILELIQKHKVKLSPDDATTVLYLIIGFNNEINPYFKNANFIKFLLENGARIDHFLVDPHGDHEAYTPIHMACKFGLTDIVHLFAYNKGNQQILKTYQYGKSVLIVGIENQHLNLVKSLVSINSETRTINGDFSIQSSDTQDLLTLHDYLGIYPLEYAVMGNDPEIFRFILSCLHQILHPISDSVCINVIIDHQVTKAFNLAIKLGKTSLAEEIFDRFNVVRDYERSFYTKMVPSIDGKNQYVLIPRDLSFLITASKSKDLTIVESTFRLLEKMYSELPSKFHTGLLNNDLKDALYFAVNTLNDEKLAKFFIQKLPPQHKTSIPTDILRNALKNKNLLMVALLLQHGAAVPDDLSVEHQELLNNAKKFNQFYEQLDAYISKTIKESEDKPSDEVCQEFCSMLIANKAQWKSDRDSILFNPKDIVEESLLSRHIHKLKRLSIANQNIQKIIKRSCDLSGELLLDLIVKHSKECEKPEATQKIVSSSQIGSIPPKVDSLEERITKDKKRLNDLIDKTVPELKKSAEKQKIERGNLVERYHATRIKVTKDVSDLEEKLKKLGIVEGRLYSLREENGKDKVDIENLKVSVEAAFAESEQAEIYFSTQYDSLSSLINRLVQEYTAIAAEDTIYDEDQKSQLLDSCIVEIKNAEDFLNQHVNNYSDTVKTITSLYTQLSSYVNKLEKRKTEFSKEHQLHKDRAKRAQARKELHSAHGSKFKKKSGSKTQEMDAEVKAQEEAEATAREEEYKKFIENRNAYNLVKQKEIEANRLKNEQDKKERKERKEKENSSPSEEPSKAVERVVKKSRRFASQYTISMLVTDETLKLDINKELNLLHRFRGFNINSDNPVELLVERYAFLRVLANMMNKLQNQNSGSNIFPGNSATPDIAINMPEFFRNAVYDRNDLLLQVYASLGFDANKTNEPVIRMVDSIVQFIHGRSSRTNVNIHIPMPKNVEECFKIIKDPLFTEIVQAGEEKQRFVLSAKDNLTELRKAITLKTDFEALKKNNPELTDMVTEAIDYLDSKIGKHRSKLFIKMQDQTDKSLTKNDKAQAYKLAKQSRKTKPQIRHQETDSHRQLLNIPTASSASSLEDEKVEHERKRTNEQLLFADDKEIDIYDPTFMKTNLRQMKTSFIPSYNSMASSNATLIDLTHTPDTMDDLNCGPDKDPIKAKSTTF